MLDELCPKLPEATAAADVQARLNALASGYGRLRLSTAEPIDYSAPATQAAYVYKYVAGHADLIYQALADGGEVTAALFGKSTVRIACFGGGPGTELIGIFKFVERLPKRPKRLICTIFDRNEPWTSALAATVNTAPAGIAVEVTLAPFDLQEAKPPLHQKLLAGIELITFSFCLSEVWRYNGAGAVTKRLNQIIDAAPEGALILYSDNKGDDFDPHVKSHLLDHVSLDLLQNTAHEHMLIGVEEKASELADYKTWVGGMSAKLTGKARRGCCQSNANSSPQDGLWSLSARLSSRAPATPPWRRSGVPCRSGDRRGDVRG